MVVCVALDGSSFVAYLCKPIQTFIQIKEITILFLNKLARLKVYNF